MGDIRFHVALSERSIPRQWSESGKDSILLPLVIDLRMSCGVIA
jgi:hypothetical protein